MPSPGSSGFGAPSVSNETRVNSGSASGVPLTPVAGFGAGGNLQPIFVSGEKKKNLQVIHDKSCPC